MKMLPNSTPIDGKEERSALTSFRSMLDQGYALAVSLVHSDETGGKKVLTTLLEQFALSEASLTLVRMLRRFERIELVGEKTPEPAKQYGFVLTPKGGVNVRLFEARSG